VKGKDLLPLKLPFKALNDYLQSYVYIINLNLKRRRKYSDLHIAEYKKSKRLSVKQVSTTCLLR